VLNRQGARSFLYLPDPLAYVVYTSAVVPQPPDPRVQRVARLLETLVRVKGISLRHLERQLGASVGTARRIFTGAISFKLSHILDILEIVDIPPALFFRIAFEDSDPQALDEAQVLLAKAQKITLPKAKLETDPEPVLDEKFLRLVEVALERFGVIPAKPSEEHQDPPKASAKATQKDDPHPPRAPRRRRGVGKQHRVERPGKS
jgi:transcriptional regulator with XRE-family HTH domain